MRAAVKRVILAEPARGQLVDAHYPQALIARCLAREDRRGRIARAIVDDNHLAVRVILRQHRVERDFQVTLFVARRDHHRYARRVRRQRDSNITQEAD